MQAFRVPERPLLLRVLDRDRGSRQSSQASIRLVLEEKVPGRAGRVYRARIAQVVRHTLPLVSHPPAGAYFLAQRSDRHKHVEWFEKVGHTSEVVGTLAGYRCNLTFSTESYRSDGRTS